MKRLNQRGVVLVQVMVLAMVLGTIASMLIQFQYSRYVTAYRVDSAQRTRAVAQAALNKYIADNIQSGATSIGSGTVSVTDAVFGTCVVTVQAYNWDSATGQDIRATFDPCNTAHCPSFSCFY